MIIRTVFIDTRLPEYQTLVTKYDASAFNSILLIDPLTGYLQIQEYLTANNLSVAGSNVVSASASINGVFSPRVVFIDPSVADYQTLIADMPANATIVVLDAAKDGVQQIHDYLANNVGLVGAIDIDSLDIVSHGTAGEIKLGSAVLNSDTLADYMQQLAEIGNYLTQGGDIVLYGCNVAAGDIGQQFIQALAVATDADVAASTGLTGGAAIGGDWVLEANTGTIEMATISNLGFAGVLAASVPDLDTADDTGTSSADNITNQTTNLTFTGTMNNKSNVTLFDDIDNNGAIGFGETLATHTGSSGVTSYSFNVSLTEGAHNIRAAQTTAGVGGGTTNVSSALAMRIDTTRPMATNVTPGSNEDTTITVTLSAADAGGSGVAHYKLSSLPLNGTLYTDAGATITANTSTDYTSSTFYFKPTTNYNGSASFNYVANDVAGNTSSSATATITINAVNDAPASTDNSVTINEDTTVVLSLSDFGTFADVDGSSIAAVKITALESAGSLEYNNGSWVAVTVDQEISAADVTDGKLRFTPDANANASPYATIGFKVGDGADFSVGAYILTVNVIPVNGIPAVTLANTTTDLNENTDTSVRIKVADISIADDAEGTNNITLSGDDAASFEVEGTVLYLKAGTTLDYEAQSSYAVTVNVDDSTVGSTPDASQSFTLNVTNLDEVAPTITSGATADTIAENSGAGQVVYTATSADANDIASGSTTYSLKSADDAAAFSIDGATGAVTLTDDPDHEGKSSYSFTVVATDAAGNSSEQAVSLAIGNLDEVPVNHTPILIVPLTNQAVQYGMFLNYDASTSFSDTDLLDSLSFSATLANGDLLPAWLQIGAATGLITGAPGFDDRGTYALNITATDTHGSSVSAPLTVAATVFNAGQLLVSTNGDDTLAGSLFNDTVTYAYATSSVTVSLAIATQQSTGGSGLDVLTNIDNLIGSNYNDSLTGNTQNNVLDGGVGADTLMGELGDDSYVVDNASDIITEKFNAGVDKVNSSVTYMLSGNIENLTLIGALAINGTGNGLANTITGNAANNVLNGGAGADILVGGLGDDSYIVDNASDVITENFNEGTDKVSSSMTYTLSANVENLVLTGALAIDGTGNDLANSITGNAANNVLNGGVGADTLIGRQGDDSYIVDNVDDVITENLNGGTDNVNSSVTYTLSANVENLTLTGALAINGTGNSLANTITGNAAINILNGGAGADILVGGLGDDSYIVDNAGDVIIEYLNEGADKIYSRVTYTLPANVENLTLTGALAINGEGNDMANTLTGNAADNQLDGGTGNDILNGGQGTNSLTGGAGNDIFRFTTTDHVDTITDYNVVNDTVQLEDTVFTALTTTGRLAVDQFIIGSEAVNPDDFIIYNNVTGTLLYDADGSGVGAAIQIVTIGVGLSMISADIVVI